MKILIMITGLSIFLGCATSGKLSKLSQENLILINKNKYYSEQIANEQKEKYVPINSVRINCNRLVYDFQEELKNKDIQIVSLQEILLNNYADKILFDSGKAELTKQARVMLDNVGTILKNITDKQIVIEGYADNVPIGNKLSPKYSSNMDLSADRAAQAAKYLVEHSNLNPDLISTFGRGDNNPASADSTAKGMARNRRIEITLTCLLKKSEGLGFILTDNYENRELFYYYYIPKKVVSDKKTDILVYVSGLSGGWWDFSMEEIKRLVDEEGMIVVSPSFSYDEANWENRQSYQYPEVWSGQALLNILEKMTNTNKIQIGKLYFIGYAAGAQFVMRFSLWTPEMCVACVGHASGGQIVPKARNQVKYFVGIGKQDSSDRISNMKIFRNVAESLGIVVVYKEYEIGHSLTHIQILDSIKFIKEALQN